MVIIRSFFFLFCLFFLSQSTYKIVKHKLLSFSFSHFDTSFFLIMSLTNSDIAAVAALLQQPAMEPPEGVTPDFENPPNDNDLACFVITFTLVVSTLCVLLRAFDKCYLSRQYRVEDLLILGAYVRC